MSHPDLPQTTPSPAVTPTSVTVPVIPQVQTLTPEQLQQQLAQVRAETQAEFEERLEQERQARAALEERMAAFSTDLEQRQAAEQAAREAAERAAEEKRQAELSFEERSRELETRLTGQVTSLEQQLQQRDAVLEQERRFNELMGYRSQQLAQHGDDIMPELHDLVAGNTPEEIDQSISALKERTASILANVAQAAQQTRQSARGVGVTAPPVGPMDTNSGHQSYSAEDIRDMDMTQWAQLRGRLLGAASQTQRGQGMFG